MPPKIDLKELRFGHLIVIREAVRSKQSKRTVRWLCDCDCGMCSVVNSQDLRSGKTKSCGCMKRVDLTGKHYGRLTVLGRSHGAPSTWDCRCECGSLVIVRGGNLHSGSTKSCGCLRRDHAKQLKIKHGHAPKRGRPSREYRSWQAMKRRCFVSDNDNYRYYGGRGITVCERWKNSFENFMADMGPRPKRRTLDRIDSDGNYEPGNCRWATGSEQRLNQRRMSTSTKGEAS